ncbi:hypothetical protein [Anaerotignum sp.]
MKGIIIGFIICLGIVCLAPIFISIPIPVEHSLITYYTLAIAAFSLIATIMIAVLVYWAQKQDEETKSQKHIKRAKALMSAEIEAALDSMIFMTEEFSCGFIGKSTRELFQANAAELQECLTQDQFRHLSSIVQFIDSWVNEDEKDEWEGYHLILRDWVTYLMCSRYKEFYPMVENYHELLNKRTIDLLNALNDKEEVYIDDLYTIHSIMGNEVFQYDPKTKVYVVDDGMDVVLTGTLGSNWYDEIAVKDGYEKSKKYVGHYKNYKRDGEGITFDAEGNKMEEGLWQEDKLIDGTEFNLIFLDNDEEDDDYISSYGMVLDMSRTILSSHIEEFGIDCFYMIDRKVYGNKVLEYFNKRTLESFLKEHNTDLWNMYKEIENF